MPKSDLRQAESCQFYRIQSKDKGTKFTLIIWLKLASNIQLKFNLIIQPEFTSIIQLKYFYNKWYFPTKNHQPIYNQKSPNSCKYNFKVFSSCFNMINLKNFIQCFWIIASCPFSIFNAFFFAVLTAHTQQLSYQSLTIFTSFFFFTQSLRFFFLSFLLLFSSIKHGKKFLFCFFHPILIIKEIFLLTKKKDCLFIMEEEENCLLVLHASLFASFYLKWG